MLTWFGSVDETANRAIPVRAFHDRIGSSGRIRNASVVSATLADARVAEQFACKPNRLCFMSVKLETYW